MDALLGQVLACRGDLDKIFARLSIAKTTFARQLSALHVRGWARTFTAIGLSGLARPLEGRALVRLTRADPAVQPRFEAMLLADPAVLKADQICGDYDYRLWVAHADFADLDEWMARIRVFDGVSTCCYDAIQRRHGDELAGVILHRNRGRKAAVRTQQHSSR